jgi:hypothetical protein
MDAASLTAIAIVTAVFSWPGTAVICICFGLFLFRNQLRELIGKIIQLKFPGFELQAQAKEQQESKPPEEGLPLPPSPKPLESNATQEQSAASTVATLTTGERATRADLVKDFGLSPLVIAQEMAIRRDLSKLDRSAQEQVNILIRHLAVVQLTNRAETTYRLIFGSQIALLTHLNLFGPTSVVKLIADFYMPAAKRYPALYEAYPQDGYFKFLQSNGLIAPTPNAGYEITLVGRAFLQWMTGAGISMGKLG